MSHPGCVTCGETNPNEFAITLHRRSGEMRPKSKCRACENTFRRISRRLARHGLEIPVWRSCSNCSTLKPLSAFHDDSRGKYGKMARCVECHWKKSYESRVKNDSPERVLDRGRKSNFKKFGITPEDYDALLEEHEGVCAICGCPPGTKLLCIDHDHCTGTIRGLLCSNCNVAIGMLGDDPERVLAAHRYLAESSNR